MIQRAAREGTLLRSVIKRRPAGPSGPDPTVDEAELLWPASGVDAVQLRLFPPAKPLLERFGQDFFRRIPEAPGVYIMSGQADRILYIGQSRRLRSRLNTYKNLNPERTSRRLVRLVHQVRAITWEVCPSAEAAQLRENELLRLHKPRFNVLNTRPEHYAFVGLSWSPAELRLRLTRQAVSEGGERLHGAFKGLGAVRRALAALLRVLWIGQTQTALPHQLPAPLLAPVPPGRFALAVRRGRAEEWGQGVDQFLAGQSNELLGRVAAELPPAAAMCPFQQRLCAQDLECLEDFYRFGPRRSRELRENLGLDAPLIAQHELDDLLVLRQPAEAYRGDTE